MLIVIHHGEQRVRDSPVLPAQYRAQGHAGDAIPGKDTGSLGCHAGSRYPPPVNGRGIQDLVHDSLHGLSDFIWRLFNFAPAAPVERNRLPRHADYPAPGIEDDRTG
jgi:hypothetical protein